MTNPCGCENSNASMTSVTIQQEDQQAQCFTNVHETVCVQAQVTITPRVVAGQSQSFCVGNPMIGACPGTPSPTGTCTFAVSQNICVQIPLTFFANATAVPTGIVCGTPALGACPTPTCTHTIGFFRNHPDVTNALITAAGGSIELGSNDTGASFVVTIANANAVLNFNTPSPPAPPSSSNFFQQYQNLYAQLLAANLNVLNGATCPFATSAISAANAFLEASPRGVGMAGAPTFQAPLAQFNEGLAPGCPVHCPEDNI